MTESKTVEGTAQNAKAGAVVITADGPIYLEKLSAWPDAMIGRKVKATGVIVEREGEGTPTRGGIVGMYSVLTEAQWQGTGPPSPERTVTSLDSPASPETTSKT